MDAASLDKLFANKKLVINAIKRLRELEASCEVVITTDPESRKFWLQKMNDALLEFKTAKFELISYAYYGENPDPYNLMFDD